MYVQFINSMEIYDKILTIFQDISIKFPSCRVICMAYPVCYNISFLLNLHTRPELFAR